MNRNYATKGRRVGSGIMSILMAIAIIFGGTFAWSSVSQQATNPIDQEMSSGGRVHDNFNRDNGDKAVFAENFGERDILVRIRLFEFLEHEGVTFAPNTNRDFPLGNGTYNAWCVHRPLIGGAEINPSYNINPIGQPRQYRSYVTWNFGGQNWFLPTHNQDNRCLQTVASGHGIDSITNGQNAVGRRVYLDPNCGERGTSDCNCNFEIIENDGTHNFWSQGDYAYYYLRTNNGGVSDEHVRIDVRQTMPDQGVLTMNQWITLGRPMGNFWVIDEEDGWAYWAAWLEPGTATSLLLESISPNLPDGSVFYAIHVQGEFAIGHTWEQAFDENGISNNAMDLVDRIIGNPASLSITRTGTGVATEDTVVQLSSSRTRRGVTFAAQNPEWEIVSAPTWAMSEIELVDNLDGTASLLVGPQWQDFDRFTDNGINWVVLYTCESTGNRLVITEQGHDIGRRWHNTGGFRDLQDAEIRTHVNNWWNSNVSTNLREQSLSFNMPPDVRNAVSPNVNGFAQEGVPTATAGIIIRATYEDGGTSTITVNINVRNRSESGPWSGNNGFTTPLENTNNANDTAFFLSISEVNYYFPNTAEARLVRDVNGNARAWWLRSPGTTDAGGSIAAIWTAGYHSWMMANYTAAGNQSQRSIRPAMWIGPCENFMPAPQ